MKNVGKKWYPYKRVMYKKHDPLTILSSSLQNKTFQTSSKGSTQLQFKSRYQTLPRKQIFQCLNLKPFNLQECKKQVYIIEGLYIFQVWNRKKQIVAVTSI